MDYTGSIYRLIDRAEDEMKEYAQRVKQLSADEIYRHSAETAAKESLLSALIHDSYELDDDDLDLILTPAHILWRPQCQPVTVRVGTMSRWSQNRTRYSVSPEMPLTGSL